MTSQPDVTDFECCRTIIYQIVNLSLARRNQLLADGVISKNEYLNIGQQYEIPLRRQAKDLTLKIFDGIVLSMAAFQSNIDVVKNKLKKAIDNIQSFQKSVDFLNKFIVFFGNILLLPSKGITGIPALIDDLVKLI
ncbi:hypothetical protein [Nostoc sp. PA-18-2419]|uniref:hypothetical protein n=1 Tax=Nostoc sp. PA-18-2419 TaxID=2575443 RepID=UPI001107BE8A|nr:hypothetical protein [Nostoc sp. PA-18-2419]